MLPTKLNRVRQGKPWTSYVLPTNLKRVRQGKPWTSYGGEEKVKMVKGKGKNTGRAKLIPSVGSIAKIRNMDY